MTNLFENFYFNVVLMNDDIKVPCQANHDDAGFDVYAPDHLTIWPNTDVKIPLGWMCEFPKGYVMKFTNKSGRAVNDKLVVGADTVDAGYRGQVHCHLFNLGTHPVNIKKGEKISQFMLLPCWHGVAKVVKKLNESDRGDGGFGSTGLT